MFALALSLAAYALEPLVPVEPDLVGFDEPILFIELGEAARTDRSTLSGSERLPEVDDEVWPEPDQWFPEVGSWFGRPDFRPARWSLDSFSIENGEDEVGLTVSLPDPRVIDSFDEPILFLPLVGDGEEIERSAPLVVIEGVVSFDEPILFRSERYDGPEQLAALISIPTDPVTLYELPIHGPFLRMVDTEGRILDLTLAELGALYENRAGG